jgi:type II restriction enzyme
MDLSFQAGLADAYKSSLQRIRILSERWVGSRLYCPNCGNAQILQYGNNNPVADFFCSVCREDYELKSQRKHFGAKVVDGAYPAMIRRLSGNTIPNLFLLNYDFRSLTVTNLLIVPKHFFTTTIIEERKPLPPTAKRAGWVGCRILLQAIPQAGRITLIRNGVIEPKADVLDKWKRNVFLRKQRNSRSRRFTPLKMNSGQYTPIIVISKPKSGRECRYCVTTDILNSLGGESTRSPRSWID